MTAWVFVNANRVRVNRISGSDVFIPYNTTDASDFSRAVLEDGRLPTVPPIDRANAETRMPFVVAQANGAVQELMHIVAARQSLTETQLYVVRQAESNAGIADFTTLPYTENSPPEERVYGACVPSAASFHALAGEFARSPRPRFPNVALGTAIAPWAGVLTRGLSLYAAAGANAAFVRYDGNSESHLRLPVAGEVNTPETLATQGYVDEREAVRVYEGNVSAGRYTGDLNASYPLMGGDFGNLCFVLEWPSAEQGTARGGFLVAALSRVALRYMMTESSQPSDDVDDYAGTVNLGNGRTMEVERDGLEYTSYGVFYFLRGNISFVNIDAAGALEYLLETHLPGRILSDGAGSIARAAFVAPLVAGRDIIGGHSVSSRRVVTDGLVVNNGVELPAAGSSVGAVRIFQKDGQANAAANVWDMFLPIFGGRDTPIGRGTDDDGNELDDNNRAADSGVFATQRLVRRSIAAREEAIRNDIGNDISAIRRDLAIFANTAPPDESTDSGGAGSNNHRYARDAAGARLPNGFSWIRGCDEWIVMPQTATSANGWRATIWRQIRGTVQIWGGSMNSGTGVLSYVNSADAPTPGAVPRWDQFCSFYVRLNANGVFGFPLSFFGNGESVSYEDRIFAASAQRGYEVSITRSGDSGFNFVLTRDHSGNTEGFLDRIDGIY